MLGEDSAQVSADSLRGRDTSYEVVVVSYRSRQQIEALLAALPASAPVAIVDNARGEDGVHQLVATRRGGRYVDSGGGKGFARAANMGARTSTAEYVVFVNPDAEPTGAIIDALLRTLREDRTVVSVSPLTRDPRDRVELGIAGYEPTPARALGQALGLHKLVPSAGIWARPGRFQPVEVEWMSGACLAVRRHDFLRLGGFDERYFVYNEDMAFGRRVRESGLRQVLRTDLLVPHQGAGSGGGSRVMLRQRGASMTQYVRDHNARRRAEAVRAFLTLGYVARLLLCTATGHRAQAGEHVAYLRGLWGGPPTRH